MRRALGQPSPSRGGTALSWVVCAVAGVRARLTTLLLALGVALGFLAGVAALPGAAYADTSDTPELHAIRTPHFVFTFHKVNLGLAQPLAAQAEHVRARLCGELGVPCFERPVRVHLAASLEEFRAEQPGGKGQGGHLDWAVGIAYTRRDFILMRTDRRAILNLEEIFVHEVSHIVLRNGVDHAFLPRWFVEGVAILQAGEGVIERLRATNAAALTRSLVPIKELAFRFPRGSAAIDLAYAESILFLRWLLTEHAPGGHVKLIARVAAGERFRDAFPAVFGDDPMSLWEDWRDEVSEGASWIPVLTDSGLLWVILTLVFLWVYRKKRKEVRDTLDRWEEDDTERQGAWYES